MRAFAVLAVALLVSSAMGSIDDDIFSMDQILGRGLLASGSSLPSGTVKFTVTLSFSGSAPTGDALTTFKTSLASTMAATLFENKVSADDITISVTGGRRRLLAFSASGSITSTQTAIDAAKAAFTANKAAFETAVKADPTLKTFGFTGVSANTATASMTSIAVATCAIIVMAF